MPRSDPFPPAAWADRWPRLARSVGLGPGEPVLVALSGGADSVLLLHLVAVARPRPPVVAVHVAHGLRGPESELDAQFCQRLCRGLGVPFVRRSAPLDPGPNLEARAREARYRALAQEARRTRTRTILTGHHADDGLETLILRWVRGTTLTGLAGLRARRELGPLSVVRPLIGMRREEVRRLLEDAGLAWREDTSNRDLRFARNRVRNVLLPRLEELGGPESLENLRAFGRAVEQLEDHLARGTAHLEWSPRPGVGATRPRDCSHLGGVVPRSELMRLAPTLLRRALWRLVLEGTGGAPGRRLLDLVTGDLRAGRTARHALPRGWTLQLRAASVELLPPRREPAPAHGAQQLEFAFEPPRPTRAPGELRLSIPGAVVLPDGRRLVAELVDRRPDAPVPRGRYEVELDARGLTAGLTVRPPRPGERFRPLGAPGSRPLRRFLADEGVPREERASVPLVTSGARVLWAAGLRPADDARVRADTHTRLRLRLEGAAREGPEPAAEPVGRASRAATLWEPGAARVRPGRPRAG